MLQENLRQKRTAILSISSLFTGVIPEDVKEKIGAARKDFGDEIYIFGEVQEWSLKKPKRLPEGEDPLVIGRMGDCYFLIADFDTTPVEDAFFFNS